MEQVSVPPQECSRQDLHDMFRFLYQTWERELTDEEKEAWLWNAGVEMIKIKYKRNPAKELETS